LSRVTTDVFPPFRVIELRSKDVFFATRVTVAPGGPGPAVEGGEGPDVGLPDAPTAPLPTRTSPVIVTW
jgi:hypothetical protein